MKKIEKNNVPVKELRPIFAYYFDCITNSAGGVSSEIAANSSFKAIEKYYQKLIKIASDEKEAYTSFKEASHHIELCQNHLRIVKPISRSSLDGNKPYFESQVIKFYDTYSSDSKSERDPIKQRRPKAHIQPAEISSPLTIVPADLTSIPVDSSGPKMLDEPVIEDKYSVKEEKYLIKTSEKSLSLEEKSSAANKYGFFANSPQLYSSLGYELLVKGCREIEVDEDKDSYKLAKDLQDQEINKFYSLKR